jgi:xylan 1,4-beta-xylosidase
VISISFIVGYSISRRILTDTAVEHRKVRRGILGTPPGCLSGVRTMPSRLLVPFLVAFGAAAHAQPAPVTIHADRVVGEIRPIWNYFGYDEAGTTLTREGRHLLAELNTLSAEPIRIRVHHLLTSGDGTLALKWSSTNVYSEDSAGNPRYDWTRLDAIMDELSRPGIEPFVQAGFMPQALSSQPEPYTPKLVKSGLPRDMVSGGAFYPPKDYRKWEALIEAWARHSAERYGVERASAWLWELWNEPESPYWRGTPQEYFRLYDHFAVAVKRALPKARVGGPHVTDPGWKNGDVFMRAFLEHCRSGKNAATGGSGAPLDFVAFHAKGTTRLDEKGRVEMNLRNHLKSIDTYGRIIASFPEFADLPVYIGESDPEGCAGCPATLDPQRDYRRTSQFAAYTAASFMRKQDLLARTGGNLQGAVSWAFTFSEQPWFNGLRALTTNEVDLPVFNTFRLFARLAPGRLAVEAPGMIPLDAIIADSVRGEPDVGVVASTDAARSRLTILLWNYHDVAGDQGDRRELRLTIAGLPVDRHSAKAVELAIDDVSGNAYTAWLAMGSPQAPTHDQIARLRAAATMRAAPRTLTRHSTGEAQLDVTLPRQSVKLIEIELRANARSANRGGSGPASARADRPAP